MHCLVATLLCWVISAAPTSGVPAGQQVPLRGQDKPGPPRPGALAGCIVDSFQGGSLPGVTVLISRGPDSRRVVTDASGCYAVAGLDAGEYVVEATFAGFRTASSPGVGVRLGETTRADFVLCPATMFEIHWVVPASYEDLVKSAETVVHVRITGTRLEPHCEKGWLHSAQLLAVVKPAAGLTTQSIEFSQDLSSDDLKPYPVGTELVVALSPRRGNRPFERIGGPFAVYIVKGGLVSRARNWPTSRYDGMAIEAFLDALRQLQRP